MMSLSIPGTQSRAWEILCDAEAPMTIEELAAASGLKTGSVRNYVNYWRRMGLAIADESTAPLTVIRSDLPLPGDDLTAPQNPSRIPSGIPAVKPSDSHDEMSCGCNSCRMKVGERLRAAEARMVTTSQPVTVAVEKAHDHRSCKDCAARAESVSRQVAAQLQAQVRDVLFYTWGKDYWEDFVAANEEWDMDGRPSWESGKVRDRAMQLLQGGREAWLERKRAERQATKEFGAMLADEVG